VVTRLHGLLKREVTIKGRAYVVALDDDGIKLTLKGRRKGQQVQWDDLVSGDAALAVALSASLAQANDEQPDVSPKKKARRAGKQASRPPTTRISRVKSAQKLRPK
jgi:hypothetical protein